MQHTGKQKTKTNQYQYQYLIDRSKEVGLTLDQALNDGLGVDHHGNILQYIRFFTGERITYDYRPKEVNPNSIGFQQHVKENPLFITRYTPASIEKLKCGKYRFPSKQKTGFGAKLPIPTNLSISNYNNNVTGGTISITEGYFKALAASMQGIDMVAFSGIFNFDLSIEFKEYILSRKPKNFIIHYDGDGRNAGTKGQIITDKRPRNFDLSAKRFATLLFKFLQSEGLKMNVYVSMVNPDLQYKGFDDLLNAWSNKEEVTDTFNSCVDSKFFLFSKLSKSNYKGKISTFFGVDNPINFYENNKELINGCPYLFNGIELINRSSNLFTTSLLRTVSDPFEVTSVNKTELTVDKYISEATGTVDGLIDQYNKLALNVPTGTGKTSFFTGYKDKKNKWIKGYAERKKEHIVLAVPTVALVKQLKRAVKNVATIHGYITKRQRTKAMQSRVIICTYDTLHHIADLENRILIIDESHNLVNAVNYRRETLIKITHLFDTAKKTILLSGTTSKALCKVFKFHYVNVQRLINPEILYTPIIAQGDGTQKENLISATVNHIAKNHKAEGKDFLLFNCKKSLQIIKGQLIKKGFKDSEIDIICSEDVRNENIKIQSYRDILNKQKIGNQTKIILSTCLIAEGININNVNIGNIYTVNVSCIDMIRQYVARFRKLDRLQLNIIYSPNQSIKKSFRDDTESNIESQEAIAKAHLRRYEKKRTKAWETLSNYDAEYYDSIEDNPATKEMRKNNVYFYGDQYHVDQLNILSNEYGRKIKSAPNCYIFAQLDKLGWIVNESLQVNSDTSEIKKINQKIKNDKNKFKDSYLNQLELNPKTVISEAVKRDRKSRNNTIAYKLVPESDIIDCTDFENEYKQGIKNGWVKGISANYCKLRDYYSLDHETVITVLKSVSKSNLKSFFNASISLHEYGLYQVKHHRRKLPTNQKTDISNNIKLGKHILKRLSGTKTITSKDLLGIVRKFHTIQVIDKNGKLKPVRQNITLNWVNDRLTKLFKFERKKVIDGYEYQINDSLFDMGNYDENVLNLFDTFLSLEIGKRKLKPLIIIKLNEIG